MQEPVNGLMLEFLAWIASRLRTYQEAIEAWRSTCPRRPVGEDAFLAVLSNSMAEARWINRWRR